MWILQSAQISSKVTDFILIPPSPFYLPCGSCRTGQAPGKATDLITPFQPASQTCSVDLAQGIGTKTKLHFGPQLIMYPQCGSWTSTQTKLHAGPQLTMYLQCGSWKEDKYKDKATLWREKNLFVYCHVALAERTGIRQSYVLEPR